MDIKVMGLTWQRHDGTCYGCYLVNFIHNDGKPNEANNAMDIGDNLVIAYYVQNVHVLNYVVVRNTNNIYKVRSIYAYFCPYVVHNNFNY